MRPQDQCRGLLPDGTACPKYGRYVFTDLERVATTAMCQEHLTLTVLRDADPETVNWLANTFLEMAARTQLVEARN